MELCLWDCTSLTAITVDTIQLKFNSSLDGVLFNKVETTLIQCPGGKAASYTFPTWSPRIGDEAILFLLRAHQRSRSPTASPKHWEVGIRLLPA